MESEKKSEPKGFIDEKKALACIHCGLCLPSCPTYLETGNENDSPRGRIYLMRGVQENRIPFGDTFVRHIDRCLGCRACEAVCPSGVAYGELLEGTRDYIERGTDRSIRERILRRGLIARVLPNPGLLKKALMPAKVFRALRLDALLPSSIRRLADLGRGEPAGEPIPDYSPTVTATARGRLGFLRGCVADVLFSRTNTSTVRLLNRAGYDVATPPSQGCCGALHGHSGNLNDAAECARRNIAAFEDAEVDRVVVNAAGCGSMMKEYGHLLRNDPAWRDRAEKFSARVADFTEIFDEGDIHALRDRHPSSGPVRQSDQGRVTYHDACHLAHPQGIRRQPRDLLRAVVGDRYVELPESDVCCGSAGSYNLTEPEMAGRLGKRKADAIAATGASTVVTTNPGCMLQMRAALDAAGTKNVRVLHLAAAIEEFLPNNSST